MEILPAANIIMIYIALFGVFVGIALTVAGVIIRAVGKARMKKRPDSKPPSKAWVVLLIIGIALIVLAAVFLFTWFSMSIQLP